MLVMRDEGLASEREVSADGAVGKAELGFPVSALQTVSGGFSIVTVLGVHSFQEMKAFSFMISVDKLLFSVLPGNRALAEVARCYHNIKRQGLDLCSRLFLLFLPLKEMPWRLELQVAPPICIC